MSPVDRGDSDRPKVRHWRLTKWAGLAACLVIGAAWALSYPRITLISRTSKSVNGQVREEATLREGALVLERSRLQPVPILSGIPIVGSLFRRVEPAVGWWPRVHVTRSAANPAGTAGPPWDRIEVVAPLWLVFLAAAGPTAWVWRLDSAAKRRGRAGCCGSCGYERTGLAAGAACPECGSGAGQHGHLSHP